VKVYRWLILRIYHLAPRNIWNWVAGSLEIGKNGYDSDTVTQMIVEKNIRWKSMYENTVTAFENQKIVTAIAHHQTDRNSTNINVLDFGGGGGHSFEIARTTFKNTSMKWVVVEREKIARMLSNQINHEALFFTSKIDEVKKLIGSVDLIFCNSALQYTDAPLYSLEELLKQNASTIFLTRSPFTESKKTITYLQPSLSASNGPGRPPVNLRSVVEGYMCSVVPIEETLDMFQNYYRQVRVFDEGKWDESRSAKTIRTFTILATDPILC
jgi:putative methyltransferase (TIGR04325 family)